MITAQRKAFLIVPIKQFIHTHILKTVNQLKQKTDIRFYSVYENMVHRQTFLYIHPKIRFNLLNSHSIYKQKNSI